MYKTEWLNICLYIYGISLYGENRLFKFSYSVFISSSILYLVVSILKDSSSSSIITSWINYRPR
jgi:hypothetical protein